MAHFLETDHNLRLLYLLALLLSCAFAPMLAQETSQKPLAGVEGVVRDSAGKPIDAVSVLLSKEEGSSPAETKTDAGGAFSFSSVAAGTYRVTVKKTGFRDAIEDSIKLSPGEKSIVNLFSRHRLHLLLLRHLHRLCWPPESSLMIGQTLPSLALPTRPDRAATDQRPACGPARRWRKRR